MTKRSEHGGGESAINREIAEAIAEETEKADRRLRSWLGKVATAVSQIEPIVINTPHPFTTMSDAEIRALGNDIY